MVAKAGDNAKSTNQHSNKNSNKTMEKLINTAPTRIGDMYVQEIIVAKSKTRPLKSICSKAKHNKIKHIISYHTTQKLTTHGHIK